MNEATIPSAGRAEPLLIPYARIVERRTRAKVPDRRLAGRRISNLLEGMPDAFITTDPTGIIQYLNPAAGRLLGGAPRELMGRPLTSLLDAPAARVLRVQVLRAVRSHGRLGTELRIGSRFYRVHIYPERGGAAIQLTDTTDVREETARARHLAAIVEDSDDAIISFTLEGVITSWNAGATRTLGYLEEEALGRSVFEIACPHSAEDLGRLLEEVEASEHTRHFDKVCESSDGRQIPVSLRISPLHDADGQVTGAAAIIRDMSSHRQLYYGLLGSERRFRQLVEDASDIIYRLDPEGGILYVNPVVEKLLGVTEAELQRTGVTALVREDHRASVSRFYREQVRSGTPSTYLEFPVVAAGGRSLWIGQTAQLVHQGGELIAIQCVARDVSAQRAAEDSLRLISDANRTLSGSLSSPTIARNLAAVLAPRTADLCLVHIFAAQNADSIQFGCQSLGRRVPLRTGDLRKLIGLEAGAIADLLGASRSRIHHLDDSSGRPALAEATQAAFRKIGITSLLITPIGARGQPIGTLLLGRGPDRTPFAAADLLLAVDIARTASLAIENARLFERAQQAVVARDQMLAVVSHDLRNPLSAVRMGTAGLLRHGKLSEGAPERLQLLSMQRAAENMRRLIQDLLDVTKMEAGHFLVNPIPISASELLRMAADALQPLVGERALQIRPGWFGATPVLLVDSERIVQVLANLVSNAAKFTPADGTILVEAHESDRALVLSVTDDGCGIPAECLPHVFERHYQISHGDSRGAGLGLTIARGIVEAHGGRIEVSSTVGEGTTVQFSLPLVKE
jgi:PAS domain S-box-containing protein